MRKKHVGGGYPSNWIRPETRLAVYLRDGLCCVYCGAYGPDEGLTLDHVDGRAAGNATSNLVASCFACNRARQAGAKLPLERVSRAPITKAQRSAALVIHVRRPAWYMQLKRRSDPARRPALCSGCTTVCPWCWGQEEVQCET